MPAGSVVIDFIAQTAAFNANITKAAQNLASNSAKMNSALAGIQKNLDLFKNAAITGYAVKYGKEFIELGKRALEYASSLGEQSQQLGVTSKDLQVYRYAATQVGISQEDMEKGLQKLTAALGQASLGAKAPAAAFKALGISIKDGQGNLKTAGDVIPEITKKFDGLTSATQRAAVERALFGKAGQQLDTLLGGGSAQLTQLTKAAEDLGIVLSEDQIQNADRTADKLAEVKTVLEANIAGAVANNAAAIYDFITALERLIAKIPSTIAYLKGLYETLHLGALNDFANDINPVSLAARGIGKAVPDMGPKTNPLAAAFGIATGQFLGGKKTPAKPLVLDDFLAGGGNKKKGGADRTQRDLEDYQQQLAQLNTQLLQAKRDNLFNVDDQLAIDKQITASEGDQLEASLRKKAVTNKQVKAHLDELMASAAAIEAQKMLTLDTRAQEQKAKDAVELQTAANDNARDLLQAQEGSVRTSSQRRDIELKLLDLDEQSQRLKLNQVIASKTTSDEEKKLAQQNLDALADLVEARRDAVKKANLNPLDAFVAGLPQDQGDTVERQLQTIADQAQRLQDNARGFADDMTDAFGNAAQGLLDMKNPMDVLRGLVGDLAHDFQKAFIVDPLKDLIRNKVAGPLSEKLFHTNAGQNGLSSKDTNEALAAAGNVSKLTDFGTAVDAAAMALQRLTTGSVSVDMGGLGTSIDPSSIDAFSGGDDAWLNASDQLSEFASATSRSTKALGDQLPALGKFAAGLFNTIGGSVSGGSGFLSGLIQVAGIVASGIKTGGGGGHTSTGATHFHPNVHPGGFATGGRPPLGVPSWIGEAGKELWVPDGPGTILPHAMSMNVARLAANGNRRGGDTYHVNVSGPMSDRDARRTGAQLIAGARAENARIARAGM